jgi:hypothetical protein
VIFAAVLTTVLAGGISAINTPIESSYLISGSDLFSKLDAYASAAGLGAFPSKDSNAIRVWARNYMSGDVTGYSVTGDSAEICELQTDFDDGLVTVQPGTCRSVTAWDGKDRVLSQLKRLSRFDNSQADCGVMDGTGYAVEGVLEGNRFAFTSDNPQECSDEVSKAVVQLLRILPSDADAP